MADVFLKIVNMSISASWLVLAVLVFRLVFKKAPKWIYVLLWGIVAVRLLCPFSIESALSLIPSAETISPEIIMSQNPAIHTGVPAINSVVNPIITETFAPEPVVSANPLQIWIPVLAMIWGIGVVLLLVYTTVSYWRLRERVRTAVLLRDNIFQSETVSSPFVLGIIKPKIYLPFHMDGQNLGYVVSHEQAHIRRRDHWWKPLGFLLLTIHCFNPLMWLAYVLLCRDIELACDEKVVKELGKDQRADYSRALVACSVNRRMIAACPLAFGEVGVKERVKSVLNYKKPTFWVVAVSVIACAVVAVCFLTDPAEDDAQGRMEEGYYLLIGADGVKEIRISLPDSGGGVVNADGSFFKKGEEVYLALLQNVTDLRGISITALGKNGEIIYALSIPKGASNEEIINIVGGDGWLLAPTGFGEAIADGKTYVYENKGIMGSFTITLCNDGTFSYYEGMASSYIGFGSWKRDGDNITLTDDGYGGLGLVNHFRIDGDDLIFVEDGSSNFIYVKVQDGERFHCTGEAFKVADSPVQIEGDQLLSLNDVIMLSQKGYDLTWSDFDQYKYIETGSGLYIRVYEINEMFELWIGGSWPDHEPMYIWLSLADDLDTRIDIRDGGVEEFITKDYSETLLNSAIYDAILDHNLSEKTVGLNNCASFVLLDKEELSGTPVVDSTDHIGLVTVYGLALYQGYDLVDGELREETGSHIPVAITFDVLNGKYSLKEYWEPRDGNYYAPDIRDKFPDKIEEEALNTQKYIAAQKQACYVQAMRHNGVEVSDPDQRPLSAEELSWFDETFNPLVYDKQGNPIGVNPWSCFFTSYYDDVRDLDFVEFMRYFPGDGSFVSDEEFAALIKLETFPFYGEVSTGADMPVPVSRYPARLVNQVLKEYAGITTADLDTSGLEYLPEYDAFYNYTSDFGPGVFTCTRGEVNGDMVRLYEELETGTDMLTLRKVGSDYQIVAHQCIEGDNGAERVYG